MAPNLDTVATMSVGITKQTGLPPRAFVTFLAGNKDYVKGVVGLAKGLRKVKSAYPLVVAIMRDVPQEHRHLLEAQGCILREIEVVHPPENSASVIAREYYALNYSKLRIWEFVEYAKMIYLDGDIQVFRNIDHLFDLPDGSFYAVMDCFCEQTWKDSPQYGIGYCQQCPDKVKWPAHMGEPPATYFNAGMFVFKPSMFTMIDLLEAVETTPPTLFAEQDLLNIFFKDIFKPIPSSYNLIVTLLWCHPETLDKLEEVYVVHYCATGAKPWRYTGKEDYMDREDIKMLVKKWWDVYIDESLDCKSGNDKVQQFTAELSEVELAAPLAAVAL